MHVFNSRFQPGDTVWYWAGNAVYERVLQPSEWYRSDLKPVVMEGAS